MDNNQIQKIRFAVIGCGHIGKRHAEMIKRDIGAELVALCDIRPKEELGIEDYDVPFFASLNEMLHSGLEIDVINICTPNGLHAEMAIQAMKSDHHVVIEKPMALTLQDAEKVAYTSFRFRKQVFCVMQNRYSPPSVWIKEMVDSGKLGKIYMVQLNCYWNRDGRYYKPGGWHGDAKLDGGTLFTQFSHFIDIMYWLFGDIIGDIRFRKRRNGMFELFDGSMGQKYGEQYAHHCRKWQQKNRRAVHERGRVLPHKGLCHAETPTHESGQRLWSL